MIVKSSSINFDTGLSMKFSQALKTTFHCSLHYTLNKLSSFLDDELVSQALEESGIATVRKRRLLPESVIGIGLYRKQSLRGSSKRFWEFYRSITSSEKQ
ncbi:transposase domain-containing protein [Rodentibacter myodis]|uniref:transposase domain-containing protein n=1 Tax=Rodentibacter myodis TaxID=1907939 RepID=UPI000986D93B